MSKDYWSLDSILDVEPKKKKGKKDKKEKKNKERKIHSLKTKEEFKNDKKKHKDSDKDENIYVPYSEFLKNGKNGLYIVRSSVDDFKVETYILKDETFAFPRVALDKKHESYKDWLRRVLEKNESEINVNKLLYASMVKPIDIPKGFLSKVISASKSDDE